MEILSIYINTLIMATDLSNEIEAVYIFRNLPHVDSYTCTYLRIVVCYVYTTSLRITELIH